jgi:hypothetical protein
MSSFSGFVKTAAILGLQSILIKPERGIFNPALPDGTFLPDILAHATIEEEHTDNLEITNHPIEQGAAISDHAFKQPAEVRLQLGWSNSPNSADPVGLGLSALSTLGQTASQVSNALGILAGGVSLISALSGADQGQMKAIYATLLQLQQRRALFTLYTGKRVYYDMLCKTLSTDSNYESENSLPITMVCQQVIIVSTQTVSLKKEKQKTASETASEQKRGGVYTTPASSFSSNFWAGAPTS